MWQIQYRFPTSRNWSTEYLDANSSTGVFRNGPHLGYLTLSAAYEGLQRTHYWDRHSNTRASRDYAIRIVNTETDEVGYQEDGLATSFGNIPLIVEAQPTPTHKEENAKNMIKAAIQRDKGKLMLVIHAKDFHDTLDSIGCSYTNEMYDNRPAASVSIASSRFEMSTECLLKREYPAKFDLSGIFSTPPRNEQLKQLCESAYQAGRKILDHYQPIDISIEIQKKIVK